MNPLARTALALALGLAATAAPAQELRVLAPASGAVVHAPELLLVYTVPSQRTVLYYLNGAPAPLRHTAVPGNDEDLFHVRVPLVEGRNELKLLDRADERTLGALTLTYAPPHSLRTAASPGDRPYVFHSREREATCGGCHSLPEVFETVADRPLAPAGKVCGACHPRVEQSPNLHGPVAVYSCFMCHEPEYAPSRFRPKTSHAAACGTCHEGFLPKILGGKKHVHGPVAAGACVVCHDPHGGKTTALVRETPPGLCLHCHADTLPMPLERNLHGKIPCTQCHDAHGGQAPMMLPEAGNAFCARCHPDVADLKSGHPVEGHPVAGKTDPSRPGRPFGCDSCHDAHALADVSKQKLLKDDAARAQFCRRCHY
ncbi:MAG: cytochrome c3 family protein [Deferrisomatales bacterium]